MKVRLANPEVTEEDIAAVVNVLRSSRLSQGPAAVAFEKALACYIGVTHAVTLNSGTTALQLALRALEIGEGDEVLLPSFSFMAVTNAVLSEKAVPVFADIEENTFNLDPASLNDLISNKTKAIVVVHTFGYPARMVEIVDFARRHGLFVIEDACEALGAEILGHRAGSQGDIGVFAFYPNKQITTGEGGALVTNSGLIAEKIQQWRNQGRQSSQNWLQHVEAGSSFRMSDINCALGLQQLSRIEEILEKREWLARMYARYIEPAEATILPSRGRVSWFTYPVLVHERDHVCSRMTKMGVECARYFPPSHLQPVMRKYPFRCGDLSRTMALANKVLCLPLFNQLSEKQIKFVCASLRISLQSLREALLPVS
jgi:perosamine synthetase